MKVQKAYTYDDLLLVPKHSTVPSRSDVDLTVFFPNGFRFSSPLVAANMKDVIDAKIAKILVTRGHLTLLHRFTDDAQYAWQCDVASSLKGIFPNVFDFLGCSVGTTHPNWVIETCIDVGFKIFCVDIAHGDSAHCIQLVSWLSKTCKDSLIIAGNVATGEGAKRLYDAGANVVKVGIGPGSICTTRKETGNGVPQMTALENVANVRDTFHKSSAIIADGGIKSAGDCVKALCYADAVMIGSIFADADEAPGEIISIGGERFKKYHGSSTHKKTRREGTVILKRAKGPLVEIISNIESGIQSGCSYQDCLKVSELREDPVFVEVSTAQGVLDHNKETLR